MSVEFSPVLSATEVSEYFRSNLPDGVSLEEFESGLSCLRDARLTVLKLGGFEKARILWLYDDELEDGHAYVCLLEATDDETAYGNENPKDLKTNGFLRAHATDMTEDIFSLPWHKL